MTHTSPTSKSWGRMAQSASWLLFFVLDSLVILASMGTAYALRYLVVWPGWIGALVREVPNEFYVAWSAFLPIGLLLLVLIQAQFAIRGMYRLAPNAGLTSHFRIIFNSTTTAAALLIIIVFLYRPFYYSRLVIAFAFVLVMVSLSVVRMVIVFVRRVRWSRGFDRARYVVVGDSDVSHSVMAGIVARPHLGYTLVGYVADRDETKDNASAQPLHFHHLGPISAVGEIIREHAIDHVIIALPFFEHHRLPGIIDACRQADVDFRMVPDLFELSFDRVDIEEFDGLPLIGLRDVSIQGVNRLIKRGLDLAITIVVSPFVLVLSALIAVAIKIDSPGSILFAQTRVGVNGRHFKVYKFRTMVEDAQSRKAELVEQNEADGPIFKIRNDPRRTRMGQLLRRTSLDELPQLWNIFHGEMSWVGPRPATPDEVARYQRWHLRRLAATPGLTGLWQVSGRSDTTFEEMVRLDIYYVEHWSVMMDLRIMLQTIPTVLSGRGAY
ncbi:MAG: sugar transferase [Chloroflexaceae bacterium]|nr:sugar transferase [Chloroflexaceae bacterium]